MLTVPSKINCHVSAISGMDCPELCLNREHFLNYPKEVKYQYNSRGFRDREWPDKLTDVIWCVGDSFTVGIGQPQDEIWPRILEKRTGKRCLNLGEDGCSNDTLALRAQEICRLYKPKLIVVMWSYFPRRRINDKDIQFDRNDFGAKEDLINFAKNFKIVDSLPTNIIHLLIPNAYIDIDKWFRQKLDYIFIQSDLLNNQQIKSILTFSQLDYARDCHHFDIKTSNHVCDLIMEKTNNFDKTSK
jgi:hypothetical protein